MYSIGMSQAVPEANPPRSCLRKSRGVISGCGPREKNTARLAPAITAAARYCQRAHRLLSAAVRFADILVIITQLPAAQAVSAAWLTATEMFGQPSELSTRIVSGSQFSADTSARLPNATIMPVLTGDCLWTSTHPMRKPVAIPSSPAITQAITQRPPRASPEQSMRDQMAVGQAGTAAAPRSPRPLVRPPSRPPPCSRCAGKACTR